MWQLICGNVVAEMEGKKNVAMKLLKIGGEREREREIIVWIKKLFWILIQKSTHIHIHIHILSMCQ